MTETPRQRAVGILGKKKLVMLEEAGLMVVNEQQHEKRKHVIDAAQRLCDGWTDDERRWLHIAVDAADINELRQAVDALKPKQSELGI